MGVHNADLAEIFAYGAKKVRADSKVERADDIFAFYQNGFEVFEAFTGPDVDFHVPDAFQEFFQMRVVEIGDMLLQGFPGVVAIIIVRIVTARAGNDPRVIGHLSVRIPMIKGWQQLAMRKVSGGAKYNQIEFGYFNDADRHVLIPSKPANFAVLV